MEDDAFLPQEPDREGVERWVLPDEDLRLMHAKTRRCFFGDCVEVKTYLY